MKLNIIKARIKRKKLPFYAGEYYLDFDSDFIKMISEKTQDKVYAGIKRNDGLYLIIGREYIYYQALSGEESRISNKEFLEALRKKTFEEKKNGNYQFIEIYNGKQKLWIKDIKTMAAIYNTLLLLLLDS